MGAFNEVIYSDPNYGELKVQFKFGLKWQYEYKIGDRIEFLPDQESDAIGTHFVGGISRYPHPFGESYLHYKITFKDGVILDLEIVSEEESDKLISR